MRELRSVYIELSGEIVRNLCLIFVNSLELLITLLIGKNYVQYR